MIRVERFAKIQIEFFESGIRVPVINVPECTETNLVAGPVRVKDMVVSGEDKLLVDAGRVTGGKEENRKSIIQALDLVASVIQTEARCGMVDL